MHNKDELLSIGEMAKLTGVGTRALHYYERINVLRPVHIDPDSGYRYYSYEQAGSIDIISTCVELGISLKELSKLLQTEDSAHYQEFFKNMKDSADRRMKSARLMSVLAEKALQKIELNQPYKLGDVYMRDFSEKIYYTKPCGQTLEGINRTKLFLEFLDEARDELDTDSIDELMVLMEYGFLCEHSADGQQYYLFFEIPKVLSDNNTMTIAPGNYNFIQNKNNKIEAAPRIFEKQLANSNHYTIVEIEDSLSDKTKLFEPIYELRVIQASDYKWHGRY